LSTFGTQPWKKTAFFAGCRSASEDVSYGILSDQEQHEPARVVADQEQENSLAVAVNSGSDKGQRLTSVLMD
jgi:hypothetical protein